MTTSLSDTGLQFASGNLIDIKTAMPSTGSYTQGDVIVEKSVNGTLSGWKRLTTGSAHVLGTDWLYFSDGITLGTTQNTTSGTSIDFTSIPSWVKRITVNLRGTSSTGTSNYLLQIGAGSVDTTGYLSSCLDFTTSSSTAGFILTASVSSGNTRSGAVILTNLGSNIWVASGVYCRTDSATGGVLSGDKSLSGALDRIRLTTVGGTDTFDAGSVNIMYE